MAAKIKEGMTGGQVADIIEQNFENLENKFQQLSDQFDHLKEDLQRTLDDYQRQIDFTYNSLINPKIGTTENRPNPAIQGQQYYDITLNKPIWFNGEQWIDAAGAAA